MNLSGFFSLTASYNKKAVRLGMQMNVPVVNTRHIPQTRDYLSNNLPSVLRTKCFNDKNLPFSEEVVCTEIGHLFEHIILDMMCALKVFSGKKSAVFSGRTEWNWEKDPYGFFNISIFVKKNDLIFLNEAVPCAANLVDSLLNLSGLSHPQNQINSTALSLAYLKNSPMGNPRLPIGLNS